MADNRNPADGSADGKSNRVITLALAAGVVAAIAIFVLFRVNWHLYSIPSGSMEPTLRVGDHMLVRKGEFAPDEIRRGDVVVFLTENNVTFVQRVIGIGGDNVRMIDGAVHLNRTKLRTARLDDYELADARGSVTHVRRILEENRDGRSYETLDLRADSQGDNTRMFSVPPGHVFVLGDNRDNANDSRFGAGYVPVDRIAGIARTIYWSPKRENPIRPVAVR